MKSVLPVLVSAVLVLGAGALALSLWLDLDGVSLGFHGWLALGLGVAVSFAVGIGLMASAFLSARRGYDDLGGDAPDPGRPDRVRPGPDREDEAQR
ncbi:MAG: hypothetical protein ACREIP_17175 [Alphaproteobacteria bacterium]